MVLERRTTSGVEVLIAPDPFDASVAGEAREEVRAMIAEGHKKLVVDLSRVNFVDSSGISVLVTAMKELRDQEGEVALLNITPRVRNLMETTRLHTVFRIFDDEAAAVEALTA